LAKGFAGECSCAFIQVAGSEFQEKYVGVGSARVKELFKLANKNAPCVIFIDEIDALGRKRSSDGESSSSEKDNTLNQLLIAMDGFQSSDGVFVIGATNRADLLDPALMRPGRIDKRIYISVPDSKTREAIINIHIKGKPHDNSIHVTDLVDLTNGMSAAQIENVLNEAMLLAIRNNRTEFSYTELDVVMNRILAGWQPTEHQFSQAMIDQIIVHEMGHAMVGFLAKKHSKLTKIVINLSSPNTPGYTVFEGSTSSLYTRDSLFEHLMILLAGRVAEEVFYNVSVTTGAINDFEEAFKLAEKMVLYYGMGSSLIYPSNSEKYKEQIDNEVVQLIQEAYDVSRFIVTNCQEVIRDCTEILQRERIMRRDDLLSLIETKYPEIMDLYIGNI
jgi:cell division protease FtsH